MTYRPTPEAATLATFLIRAARWVVMALVVTLTFLIRLPFAYKAR